MPYQQQYQDDINPILLAEKTNLANALQLFQDYLLRVVNIGPFTAQDWPYQFRKEVYRFGTEIRSENKMQFLRILEAMLLAPTMRPPQSEILLFIKSEINIHFAPKKDMIAFLEDSARIYPGNPEFHHTLGHHFLIDNENASALDHYRLACHLDSTNEEFRSEIFNNEYQIISKLIYEGKYSAAEMAIQDALRHKVYENSFIYKNHLADLRHKIKDYKQIEERIQKSGDDFAEKVKKEMNQDKKGTIEILGFFIALITLVFSGITFTKLYSISEAIIFGLSIGASQILFLLVLSLITHTPKIWFKDFRLYLLIGSTSLLLYLAQVALDQSVFNDLFP